MDKPKVFIDGREGTTGLQLWERLSRRTDLELLRIGEARRKDPAERKKYLNAADLVFLCLPDAAAWEAVGLIENGHTRIIDASTAHRTASGWVYGFPELYKDPAHQVRRSGGQPRLPRHRLPGLGSPPVRPPYSAPGLPPHLLLPHWLLRRRQKDDRPV
mgnify:CR=1 FL=1